jgi:hypothetical protein
MSTRNTLVATLMLATFANYAAGDPKVARTTVLGPFTGHDAKLHPDNLAPNRIEYYGTDLGFSYEHQGRIQFLFGDTWAIESYAPIQKSSGGRYDDGFGSVDLGVYSDPGRITADNIPLIKLGQNPGTTEMSAIDPGHAMDLGKTPMAGFSNGKREFGIFNVTKPKGCRVDADCGNGLSCDAGLGYLGSKYTDEMGLTLACVDGDPNCNADTMTDAAGAPGPQSGLCTDHSTTIWANTPAGRVSSVALVQRVGLRSVTDPRQYTDIQQWLTSKFVNMIARTVNDFAPDKGLHQARHGYQAAKEVGANRRVFLWGRPGFIGVGANHRTLGVYFAYVDLPAGPGFSWRPHYYTGSTATGTPRFSPNESDAAALDLDSTVAGIQSAELYDIVNQMSVAWVDHLKKWVMFYGGGMTKLPTPPLPHCGVLEVFAGRECQDVVIGNGAVRMRTADNPWGPWTPPQDVIVGGDPAVPGSGLYGAGGVLRHPACTAPGCATASRMPFYHPDEYGFLYSANIIDPWIKPAGPGVDVIWNASTWDPYRVALFRTRIDP